ncbi:hypothetical protein E1265_28035 [Streptomyces sp. 8K308]|uniref:DUF6616 family protein n=1 Tax=Streptomyces sp. 8K308 TaxID=2530388 RepID=UPI00104CCC63|nr:DUF6616 family protein [Streptomyces sp. 8K308]TDC13427.1 hypothetical protein E1265_28035 [Streptomyces sp. 8K308]
MHIVVEIWTPKPAFLDTPPDIREQIVGSVQEGVSQMAAVGITTLGWGRIAPTEDHPSGHDWFAVWQIPTAELVDTFFAGITESGWYEWFDQINVSGQLETVEDVLKSHLSLRAEGR